MPNIRTQTVGEFTIVTYLSGTQAIVEDPQMFRELAQCYCFYAFSQQQFSS